LLKNPEFAYNLMAFTASPAVACSIQSVFEITPVLGMRIVTSGPTSGAMATQADIAIGMTGLTSDQRFAGFPSMTD
jgi:hypothetical protein